MSEFKDKIPAAGGKIDFLYDPTTGRISTQISGTGFFAMYIVAVSMDGRHLLESVVPAGMGGVMSYRQPSVLTYMQSDEQGMWGRNCPYRQKYFRTNHNMGETYCPYCSQPESDLAFISKEQRVYLTAFYDGFARAYLEKKNTSLDLAEITDTTAAWHYSEEKQQHHSVCQTDNVEYSIGSRIPSRLRDGAECALNVLLGCEFIGFFGDFVHQPDDGKPRFFVRRQMGSANDASRSNDDDGSNIFWPRQFDLLNDRSK